MSYASNSEELLETELSQLRSVEELEALVGELSPEEQELANRLGLPRRPTEEQLVDIEQRLAKRVVARTMERIAEQSEGETPRSLADAVGSGFTLLALLAEVEVNCLLEGVPAPALTRASAKVGERMAELWLRQVEDASVGG